MARVKRGTTVKFKHKKVLERAKGFLGRHGSAFTLAKEKVDKAGQYAYRDRRAKKRTFRSLWIVRINAAVRPFGLTYARFMNGLKKANIVMDRKVLAQMAFDGDANFKKLIEEAKRFTTEK
jgi:large subunit ribosomal protein L20